MYREGETYFSQVEAFLKSQLSCQPVGAIDYAETELHIICSYYEKNNTGDLENILAVFDLEGNLCLKEVLGVSLKGLGSDTFLIFKGELYFIQHKNILVAYRLY